MGWKETDERLIRRGELVLDLSFLEHYKEELETLNRGKVGPPYLLTPSYIQLLTAVRYLYQMPYRQLRIHQKPPHPHTQTTLSRLLRPPKTHPGADPRPLSTAK